jgi:Mrp family chromosome partitioning ATPase/predicted Fe-Mo cluster-binding NifX family protein
VLVMSGKGGVGKSTVAVNLAVSLLRAGKSVGLMDADMHGPSVPKMLGLDAAELRSEDGAIIPVDVGGLKVMSVAFLLRHADDPLVWRGPLKMGMIKQFLADVEWGELDYLVVDLPPGTGDEPLSVCQLIGNADGAVVVTTPQDVALAAVRKSISFCRQLDLPLIGVVENMSGFVCPHCGTTTDVFNSGGGERMAANMGVAFLGRIPIDPAVGTASDAGTPFVTAHRETATAKAFAQVAVPVLALSAHGTHGAYQATSNNEQEEHPMTTTKTTLRFAVPLAEGKLCMHFGHCETFALVDVDPSTKAILKTESVVPPPHEPGLLPKWLAERGATAIIAGGMGSRAQGLFAERGIQVVTGATGGTPEELVTAHLAGTLQTGANACDH